MDVSRPPPPPSPAVKDYFVGATVSHTEHGAGKVECFLPDGRIKIEFDNGSVHRYRPESAHKISLVDNLVDHVRRRHPPTTTTA